MSTTTTNPAEQDAYFAQIEGTREQVEAYVSNESGAYFDTYETARKLAKLRGLALHADLTMTQEVKAHKEISRLVRAAERLQAEVERFQEKLQAFEDAMHENG
jgi:hypothetical protein